MKTIRTIIRRRPIWWGVIGTLLLTTTIYHTLVAPRMLGRAKEISEAQRNYEVSIQELKHGAPLAQSAVRMPISDLKIEVNELRVARIKRDTKTSATATMFIEGTTRSMDFAFRAYLKELADGKEDTGFFYSARGVEGERIKVITISPGGEPTSILHVVDAVSLAPPPQQDIFSSGRILKGLPEN